MREIMDRNILDDFCVEFCKIIEKRTEYVVVSGFVAISSGRARATQDIDIILQRVTLDKFKLIHRELQKNDFICIQSNDPTEIYEYLTNNTSVRYIKKDHPLPEMEVKFTKDELDQYQIKTKTKLPLTGLDIWFSSIEMNIAFKEEYLKTPKDIEDARHLRVVYEKEIDEKEINKIKEMIRKLRLK